MGLEGWLSGGLPGHQEVKFTITGTSIGGRVVSFVIDFLFRSWKLPVMVAEKSFH
jgi:hypothetical protein